MADIPYNRRPEPDEPLQPSTPPAWLGIMTVLVGLLFLAGFVVAVLYFFP